MGIVAFILMASCQAQAPASVESLEPRHAEVLRPGATTWEALKLPGPTNANWDVAEVEPGRFGFTLHAWEVGRDRGPRFCDVWDAHAGTWSKAQHVVPGSPEVAVDVPRDVPARLVPLGNSTMLVVDPSRTPVTARILPGGPQLPWPTTAGMDNLVATAWPDGVILLLSRKGDINTAHRYQPSAGQWEEVAAPGDVVNVQLFAGPQGRAVLERPGAMELWDTKAWKPLPTLLEPRVGAEVALGADGTIVVAGGMLMTPRVDGGAVMEKVRNTVGALVVFGLLAAVWRRIPRARRIPVLVITVVVGALLAWGALVVLSKLAWH